MRQAITPEIDAILKSDNVPMLVLVQLDFKTHTVRACNAGYNFPWNGETWTGLGNLGGISAISEGENLQMYGCTLTLSGVPVELIATALSSEYKEQPCTIWFAPLSHSYQVIVDPVIIFRGRMDTMSVELGDKATIQLAVESRLTDWERPRQRRYNNADQIYEFPTDKGFEFVAQMVEKEIVWGRV